jgi:hypothetical protein
MIADARIPGAAQHEVMRCRTGIFRNSELMTIPDQRRTAIALRRVRETRARSNKSCRRDKLKPRLRGDERRDGKPIKKITPKIFCVRCAVRNIAR